MYDGYHYYNNTFLNNRRSHRGPNGEHPENGFAGLAIYNLPALDRAFLNNIVAMQPNRAVLEWRMDGGGRFALDNNLYHDPTGPAKFYVRTAAGMALVQGSASWRSILGSDPGFAYLEGKDAACREADPRFINVPLYPTGCFPSWDFGVQPGSPAIDAGRALTYAISSGTGSTALRVADSRFFCDGYGVSAGDLVTIGDDAPVRVVSVDYALNTLFLDDSRSWQVGTGVHLEYAGAGPDIGAIESGFRRPLLPDPPTGSLHFSSATKSVTVNQTTVHDSLWLVTTGKPLRRLEFQFITSGRVKLRSLTRGLLLPVQDWLLTTYMRRGTVQNDGTFSDTCSVFILGEGITTLPPGRYESLVGFTYDIVPRASDAPPTTTFRLVDVIGEYDDGTRARIIAGDQQSLTIHSGVWAGDVNRDSLVDLQDILLVADHILQRSTIDPNSLQRADIIPWPSGDGVVDSRDLALLLYIVQVRAYPDGTPLASLRPGLLDQLLQKGSSHTVRPLNAVRIALVGQRMRILLSNSVPIKGLQWDIPGLWVDSRNRMPWSTFESNHWISDSLGARGVSFSPQALALQPGDWVIGEVPILSTGSSDWYEGEAIVVSADGKLVERSVISMNEKEQTTAPPEFHLAQNFPNPFNPLTTIRFTLSVSTHVRVTIYTVLGEEVATLLNQPLSAGEHKVGFDAKGLSSGVYLYRLEAGRHTATRKMVLIR
jgi:hypothetical protein